MLFTASHKTAATSVFLSQLSKNYTQHLSHHYTWSKNLLFNKVHTKKCCHVKLKQFLKVMRGSFEDENQPQRLQQFDII